MKIEINRRKMMKSKRNGVYAVMAAVLLVTALLITNCLEPMGMDLTATAKGGNPIEPGKGVVTLNFGNSTGGRTVVPTAPSGTVHYEVIFTPTNSGPVVTLYTSTSGQTFTVNVDIGTYTVIVNAYLETDGEDPPTLTKQYATGNYNGTVSILAGTNSAISVPITVISNPSVTSTGTLAWNFTVPGSPNTYDLINVSFTGITGGGSASDVTTASGDVSLTPGSYYVTVTAEKAGHLPRTIKEIAYVVSGLTSTYTRTFHPLISDQYQITLDKNDGTATSTMPSPSTYYSFGAAMNNDLPGTLTHGTDSANNVFIGWYTTASTGGVVWTSTKKVIANLTLYARWEPPVPTTPDAFEVAFPFILGTYTDVIVTGPASAITLAQVLAGTTITFTVTPPSTFAEIKWFYGDDEITSAANNETYTLDFDDNDIAYLEMSAPGTHVITVEARETTSDLLYYSGSFEYTITNP
jgi:uncharacterized repeat protein (TIGR02543 family)